MSRVSMRTVLRALLLTIILVASNPLALAEQRPNILLIVSEDNGPELGCYGDPHVRTPILDEFAAEGVRFSKAYVTQAGCSQSRASFLTGLYPHQNGQIGLATWRFTLYDERTPNVVRSLKEVGYHTGLIGKLHINPASAFPFDYEAIPDANFSRKNLDRYAESASRFFNDTDKPFFLAVNYPDAHRPFVRRAEGRPAAPLSPEDDIALPYMGLDSSKLQRDTANYYNSMERLDGLVGDLLSELKKSGKAQNTLVVYIGDHGADMLRGKRTSYEGGVRIPMIIRWPGRTKRGVVREDLVSTIDLFPTFLDAAMAHPIENLPGRALTPLLRGEPTPWRRHLFTEFHLHSSHNYFPQRTVRDDRYKLIRNLMPDRVNPGHDYTIEKFYSQQEINGALDEASEEVRAAYQLMRQPPEYELYDLRDDPFEFRNLSDEPAHSATLNDLKERLHRWQEETHDPLLDRANVLRLRDEIEATKIDGKYVKKTEPWKYPEYMGAAFSKSPKK